MSNTNYPEKVAQAERNWYEGRHPEDRRYGWRTWTGTELEEMCNAMPRPQHGDTWGGAWRFNAHNLTLEAICSGYSYYVDLEAITNRAELVRTIGHLLGKTWGQNENIGHFVQAIYDLTHPGTGEWHDDFNVAAIVRKKFRAGANAN